MDYSSSEKLFSKKNIISYLILAILIVAIPVGVQLARQQQILKSKAVEDPIKFTSSASAPNSINCTGVNCTTTSPTIDIQISSPLGPPKP